MQDLTSFLIVIALWVAISFAFWWFHRRAQRRQRARQRELAAQVWMRVREAQDIFDTIRKQHEPAPSKTGEPALDKKNPAALRAQTTLLLRRIQENGSYFDKVRALFPNLKTQLGISECPPLAEVLQIRRDLWAASEIILVEDFKLLGDAFEEPGSYENFVADAERLLFSGQAGEGEDDLIDLRLAVARADVEHFVHAIEQDIKLAEEKERLPTTAEIVSYPIGLIRAIPGQLRLIRIYLAESVEHVKLAARSIRESDTLASALREFRRAREDLPQRLSLTLEKAADVARHGRKSISAHQDFLIKAYDLQARYQELLSHAPELSERSRQFVARLELAKRSEQLREKSQGIIDDARRVLVRALAHMIAGLQRLQDRLAVHELAHAGQAPVKYQGPESAPRGRREPQDARMPASPAKDGRPLPAEKQKSASADEAKPKPHFPRVKPTALPAKPPVFEPLNEQPSEATLNRLRGLFSRRKPSPDLKRSHSAESEDAALKPAAIEQSPTDSQTGEIAKRATQTARHPAKSSTLWPSLQKLRQPQTPGATIPAKPHTKAAPKASEPDNPASPPPRRTAGNPAKAADKPLVRSLFGRFQRRSAAEPASPPRSSEAGGTTHHGINARADLLPDKKPDRPKTGKADDKKAAASQAGDSIAAMLKRLSVEEDVAFLREPPSLPKASPRTSSLIARLSKIDTAELEEIAFGGLAGDDGTSPAGGGKLASRATPAKAAPSAKRFSLFKRDKV